MTWKQFGSEELKMWRRLYPRVVKPTQSTQAHTEMYMHRHTQHPFHVRLLSTNVIFFVTHQLLKLAPGIVFKLRQRQGKPNRMRHACNMEKFGR